MKPRLKGLEALGCGCRVMAGLPYLLLAPLVFLPVPTEAGILDGLQLHIEFEDNVLDSSPNGHDGQAAGGLQYVPGVEGKAASFDGVDDQVLFPTFADGLLGANDFSLAFWFNIPLDQGFSVLSKRAICAKDPFIDIRTGNISPNVSLEVSSSVQNYFPGVTPKPSGWHHVAFTRTGTDYQSFFDGRLYTTGQTDVILDIENSATLGLSNSPCLVADGTAMLTGQIDDLRIYNRVLTNLEVASLGGIFADGFESGDTTAWSSAVP